PDGAQLYVASRFGNAVQVFARSTDPVDPAYGTLSFASVHQDGFLGIEGLGVASDPALSADGTRLYVPADSHDSIVLIDRAADGSLLQHQQWQRGGDGLPGMDGPTALGIAPDGTELYVTGYADSSLTVFRVLAEGEQPGLAAGTLVPRQTLFDDQGTLTEMGGPTALAISPDDRNIYVAANTDNAIAVFLRQAFTGVFSDGFGD